MKKAIITVICFFVIMSFAFAFDQPIVGVYEGIEERRIGLGGCGGGTTTRQYIVLDGGMSKIELEYEVKIRGGDLKKGCLVKIYKERTEPACSCYKISVIEILRED